MKRRKPILYDDQPAENGEVSQAAAVWYLVGFLWLSNLQIHRATEITKFISFTLKIHYYSNSNIIEYCHRKVRVENNNKNRRTDLQHLV